MIDQDKPFPIPCSRACKYLRPTQPKQQSSIISHSHSWPVNFTTAISQQDYKDEEEEEEEECGDAAARGVLWLLM